MWSNGGLYQPCSILSIRCSIYLLKILKANPTTSVLHDSPFFHLFKVPVCGMGNALFPVNWNKLWIALALFVVTWIALNNVIFKTCLLVCWKHLKFFLWLCKSSCVLILLFYFQYQQRRQQENIQRQSRGEPPLPEEDINKLFKPPQPPPRMESLLIAGNV